jgi:hypothetical protein
MSANTPFMTPANLFDHFDSRVDHAVEVQAVDLSQRVTCYLKQMLVELTKSNQLFRASSPETLAELHLRASASPPSQAIGLYKQLGDRALYIGGYFQESLVRKTVGVNYYADMGEAAYYRLAGLTRASWNEQGPLSLLFCEMSQAFRDCLAVLKSIGGRDRGQDLNDLVALAQRWLRTRDAQTDRLLLERGALPARTPNTEN